MGWANDALAAVLRGESVTVRPRGGSMRGRVEDGQEVTIVPVDPAELRVDDVVLVRWKGGVLLHLIRDLDGDRVLIGNNVGKINGWTSRADVLGRVDR